MSNEFIPLLSEKPFESYSPEEFKLMVRSLKKDKVRPPPKVKAEVSYSKTSKGGLTMRVNRTPKVITLNEFAEISQEMEISSEELHRLLKKKGVGVSDSEVAKLVPVNLSSIPW